MGEGKRSSSNIVMFPFMAQGNIVNFLTNVARAAFGLGAAATALNSSLYTVKEGQCAVIFDHLRGTLDYSVGEGTHFLIPWLQKPFIFNIRTRPHNFTSVSGTKDLQMVKRSEFWRPEVSKLPQIFKTLNIVHLRASLPTSIELLELPFDAAAHGLPPHAQNTDVLPYPLVNTPLNIAHLRASLPASIELLELLFDAAAHGLLPHAQNTDVLPFF